MLLLKIQNPQSKTTLNHSSAERVQFCSSFVILLFCVGFLFSSLLLGFWFGVFYFLGGPHSAGSFGSGVGCGCVSCEDVYPGCVFLGVFYKVFQDSCESCDFYFFSYVYFSGLEVVFACVDVLFYPVV